jgi:hypothetical protein
MGLVHSAAIWNMNKPAVALATGVWITNIAFLILGKSLSTSLAILTETLTRTIWHWFQALRG